MRMFKVSIMVDGRMGACDGIEHDGKLWLVALSSADKGLGLRRLDRLVRFDTLPHQKLSDRQFGEYGLTVPIPKQLFDLDAAQTGLDDFEIIDDANIEIPIAERRS